MSYICKRCNYASNFVTDTSSGEIFCPHCGVVIMDKILDTSNYGNSGFISDKESHEFTSYTNADLGLSSIIDQSGKDAYGNSLSSSSRESF